MNICPHAEAAILIDETLWMWGYQFKGQLGNGTADSSFVCEPVKILNDVSSVSSSGTVTYSCFAIRTDGSLYAWGDNKYGQLGVVTAKDYSAVPLKVTFEEGYVPYKPSRDGWGFTNGNAVINIPDVKKDKDGNAVKDKHGNEIRFVNWNMWERAIGSGRISQALYRHGRRRSDQ